MMMEHMKKISHDINKTCDDLLLKNLIDIMEMDKDSTLEQVVALKNELGADIRRLDNPNDEFFHYSFNGTVFLSIEREPEFITEQGEAGQVFFKYNLRYRELGE